MVIGTEQGIEVHGRAFAPMLAKLYDGRDPTGWLMSEKLDGVRALWTGRELVTREWNTIPAPAWFTCGLPAGVPLDGELWLGRGRFDAMSGIVLCDDAGSRWRDVCYMVFDAPKAAGGLTDRLNVVDDALAGHRGRHIRALPQRRCSGRADLDRALAGVIARGGEGLILRESASEYEPRRSWAMLKVKLVDELDAKVIAHAPGGGRNRGRLGALVIEVIDPGPLEGRCFNIGAGLTDSQRCKPPAIGSVAIVRHNGLTRSGLPRFARLHGVRADGR
jgi:DNA ligase 1